MPPLKCGQILTIMKFHLTLAAFVLFVCTAGSSAWAEVTSGQGTDASAGAAATPSTGNWSAALEKSGADTATSGDLSKDLSPEARILNEHLANFDKPGQIPDAKKAAANTAARPAGAASGAKAAAEVPDDWGSEWANKIRDFIRPIHKEVVNSEVVQVVRELDAALPKKVQSDDAAAGPAVASPVLLPVGPLTTEEQRQRDKLAASIAMEQLIDDVKPYAYALLALAILGYLGLVVWRFLMWKQGKSGKRIRRSQAARRSRSRSGAGESQGRSGSPTSRSAPLASRAAPLASRSAPLQSDTQNDQLST